MTREKSLVTNRCYTHDRPSIVFCGLTAVCMLVVFAGLPGSPVVQAASLNHCREQLRTGRYEECIASAAEAIERRAYGEDWPILKIRAERALGQLDQATATAAAGLDRYPWSIRLCYEAVLVHRELGHYEAAEKQLAEISQLAGARPWRYSDADDLVALGNAALAGGADPKTVLQQFFDRARTTFTRRPDGVLASATLALSKGDNQLAAELLEPAVEQFAQHPEILLAHALAIRGVNPQRAEASRQAALTINPRFAEALLLAVRQQIDREQFDDAVETVQKIRKTNPYHAEACALLSAIHHLRNETKLARDARTAGMRQHATNPAVDHFIGVVLSRRYRFREGAAFQRHALELQPDYQPARAQLAQDLLRLGTPDEAWNLAEAAHEADGYDTQLFNLLQLRDSMNRFTVLQDERFEVHMEKQEALVYGPRVQRLLNSAWENLTQRYDFHPKGPVIVEIYDRPDDFAVRTFGLPDVAGFLGVCFGRVVTANSPISRRSSPTNWESVLWHEFCHVITLQMTQNRIPRWLSEGISVFEERRRDSRWGQRMNPAFRDRILDGKVTPVEAISGAFLEAQSGDDINFAYFQSSMVVEFLVEEYGHTALLAVLHDLNTGLQINDALERHSTDRNQFDSDFQDWLQNKANQFAPGVTFLADDAVADDGTPLQTTSSYPRGLASARHWLRTDLDRAEAELRHLTELFPDDTNPNGARILLAELYRQRGQTEKELLLLEAQVKRSADDLKTATRLFEIQADTNEMEAAVVTGRLILGIDPARPDILRRLVDVAGTAGDHQLAAECLQALIQLDAAQMPHWRLRLAQQLLPEDRDKSRRQVLLALEAAPRFRDAHRLLLELQEQSPDESSDR